MKMVYLPQPRYFKNFLQITDRMGNWPETFSAGENVIDQKTMEKAALYKSMEALFREGEKNSSEFAGILKVTRQLTFQSAQRP